MKRSRLITFLLLAAALLAAPTFGETVRGFFEGPIGGGNAGSGALSLTGWAVADSPVRRVVIQVDGVDIGQAFYGGARPDVEADHPGFPDSANAGFGYRLNTTDFPNGIYTVTAKVETDAGTSEVIQGTRHIFFNNNSHILKPFGSINRPERHAELFGACDLESPFRRYSVIGGWALDLGLEIGDTGVGYVELLLDGSIIASTRLGDPNPLGAPDEVEGVGVCHYDPAKGGLSNCYGFPRLDIERFYPFALDAPSSGFRFVIDVGQLIARDLWPQGQHILKARVGDIAGQVADADEIPVTFVCIENIPNEPSFGQIESPRLGRGFAGVVELKGWVLDWEGVDQVWLYVDGILIGTADYGVGRRARVEMEFPGFPDTDAPAWSFEWDTNEVSEGFHQFEVIAVDDTGDETLIGETDFFVNNVHPD